MVREIITLNIGQCGIQMGHTVWKQYCKELNIDESGKRTLPIQDETFRVFFEETESEKYAARNIFVDLEADIIDNVKTSDDSKRFHSEYLLSGREDAANLFARGHYTVGKQMIDRLNDRIRTLFDQCDNPQGFILNHSVGGGTGSGLAALILERISVDYSKKSKLGFEVYPSNCHHQNISNCVVEPYNAILSTHWLLDHTDVSLIFDNRQIHKLCKSHLGINAPTYTDLNSLIAKVESATTVSLRFENEMHVDSGLNEYVANMVCFPRLHFLIPSMSPIVDNKNIEKFYIEKAAGVVLVDGYVRHYYSYPKNIHFDLLQYEPPIYQHIMHLLYQSYTDHDKCNDYMKQYYMLNSLYDLHEMCCNRDHFMVEIMSFCREEEEGMATLTCCRGNVTAKEIYAVIQRLKTNIKVSGNSWGPQFKVELNNRIVPEIDGDTLISKEKAVTMLFNNSVIRKFFQKRINHKYDLLYQQRAFVHLYVGEGMEEAEFAEAREDLAFLEKDYLDVICEQATDSDDSF